MNKIKFISKTKELLQKEGKFDPPILEISKVGEKVLFNIGTRDEINELTSECIFLSKEDARRLGKRLIEAI